MAIVQAAKLKLIWLYVASVAKNSWVDTADPVSAGGTLERFGLVKLGRPRQAAVQGLYSVRVTGIAGSVIPAGSQFSSDDSSASPQFNFILDNAFTLSSTTGTITLRALTAGVQSRLDVSDTLTSLSPLLNVDDTVTVLSE
ncbi:MAG: baseplate J/gp47 family protein, partial [Psychroserpens sp.]|nr:baseplate J/gp47 family protein [Psychroserpens sp.]